MASLVAMKKIDLLILKAHVNQVVAKIGFSESMEIIESKNRDEDFSHVRNDYYNKVNSLRQRLNQLLIDMKMVIYDNEANAQDEYLLDLVSIEENIDWIESEIGEELKKLKALENTILELEGMLRELSAFGYIDVNFTKLTTFENVYLAYGRIPKSRQKYIEKESGNRLLFIPVGQGGDYICMSSKKGKWALETALRNLDFERKDIESFKNDSIKSLIQETEVRLTESRDRHRALMDKINTFKRTRKNAILKLYISLNIQEDVDSALAKFSRTDKIYQITGWVESAKIESILEEIKKITGNRFYMVIIDPSEMAGYSQGEVKVPIKLKKRKFWSNFEILVKNYGLPEYGEIDPTLIVAITYLVMFGLMFGDVGQGLVFVIIGILMKIKKIKAMNRFRHLGLLFICMGTASMIFGALYGSYFGMEHFIAPLFVNPMNGFMKIFLIAIGFGIVFMTIGLIINIYNQLAKKRYFQAFFDKTGIFGLWFYMGTLFMAFRSLVLKKPFQFMSFEMWLLSLLPLILIVSREWIHFFIEKKHGHANDGFGSLILVTFIEILETVIYYLGNSASFLRLGALSLAHASLSFAIFTMAGLLKGSLVGNIFSILIIIIGNIFIIVLEGLVASIQTMRLQYYEFFSKFFSGTGKSFKPFKIEKVKKSI